MSTRTVQQTAQPTAATMAQASHGLLQRQCACGTHTMGGGQCAECKKKQVNGKPLQTKLAISEPGDVYEQEADRVAEQVMRMSPADVRKRQKSGVTQTLVQRRASGGATGLTDAPPIVQDVLNSPGQPLDVATRAFFEPRFGYDFSHVRVHTNDEARQSARAVNANAYAVGSSIVFSAGQFKPGAGVGQQLLAHELTHVIQQTAGILPAKVQRVPAETEETSAQVGMSASIDGLIFHVPDKLAYKPGRTRPQLYAFALKRLIGHQYKPGLELEVGTLLSRFASEKQSTRSFHASEVAKGGEPIGQGIQFDVPLSVALIIILRRKRFHVSVSEQQWELLMLGIANDYLWNDFVVDLKRVDLPLPSWYTKDIFNSEMSQHGKLLRSYKEVLGQNDDSGRRAVVGEVISALHMPMMVTEAVRLDIKLASLAETSGIYSAMWQLPKSKPGQPGEIKQPPRHVRDLNMVILFLGYMRTQPQLMRNAEFNSEERLELVKRFARYTGTVTFDGTVKEGDQTIRDQPAKANTPAFPSILKPLSDQSMLPLETPTNTDHRFEMEVQFPSVYEALGRYAFSWEIVRIPDEKIGAPVDVDKLKGHQVSDLDVAIIRFDRNTAYAREDIKRTVENITTDLGPAGVGALELVSANAILRYAGTGIRMALEILTRPLNQKSVPFKFPGLFMVRSVMSQIVEGREELVRVPSVAYYPVLVAQAEDMAVKGVAASLSTSEKNEQRIKELEGTLSRPGLDSEERRRLEKELESIRLAAAPVGKRLEGLRVAAEKHIAALRAGTEKGDLEAATTELEQIEKMIALRVKRKLDDSAQLLTARFIGDLGQKVPLTLEVVDRPAPKGKVGVYVSDITTHKSGAEKGYGETREDAIVNAVQELLEGTHGYGRGTVAIAFGTEIRTIRIAASMGSLLAESIENVSTVLSIAAVAAAPFTGGASLAILIPVGLVGAIPSAYRIANRIEAGTFELDLENVLEIVNIVGSVVSLGRMGATSLRMMRMGKAMLIVGYGVDAAGGILMGAQFMVQVEELSKLPEGERAAALMMLIGQQLVQVGIMAGGSLQERAQHMHAEQKAGTQKGLTHEVPGGAKEITGTSKEEGAAGAKPRSSEPDIFHKAQVENEMNRLGKMDPDSAERLKGDEALRTTLVDNPLAAAAFKKCASPCFPPDITPKQIERLERLLGRLKETGNYNEAVLKEYLYKRRNDLDKAITQIEGTKNAKDLNAWLEFFNDPEKKIEKLPPQGDPKLLLELRDRAHDVGVEHGRIQAKTEGLESANFENPFERQGRYGQGFDDVMKQGANLDLGDVYIVEYKGGDATLSEGQMSLEWVIGNIRRLYTEGGPKGQAWARVLSKALREGRLKGIAYSTPMDGAKPLPTKAIGQWSYQKTHVGF